VDGCTVLYCTPVNTTHSNFDLYSTAQYCNKKNSFFRTSTPLKVGKAGDRVMNIERK
jgi:hypothetical protein